jgi:hypothetical protein
LPAVLTSWAAQPKQPQALVEVAALALAHASAASDQARPLIERLRPDLPNDALLISAMLALRQKRDAEACQQLEQLFLALRSDPVMLARTAESMFPLAIEIAGKDKTQAQRFFDALSQPLAVRLMDDKRQLARCILGQNIGPAATAAALEEVEPHVPWDQEFLQMRAKAYRDSKNPRADSAAADLTTFGYWSPEVRLLPDTP